VHGNIGGLADLCLNEDVRVHHAVLPGRQCDRHATLGTGSPVPQGDLAGNGPGFPRAARKTSPQAARRAAAADLLGAHITLADLGEFGLIAAMKAALPVGQAQLVGIGDDAAVLRAPDARVVATMDLLVEGRHFRRDWSAAFDVGCKAAAQNLADIAAMGAVPTALLVGFAAPGDLPSDWAMDLVRGLAQESARAGASVAGGDVSSADTIMIAVTALGDLGGRDPVTRAGARPGDQVAVAGLPGRSAAGLALLTAGRGEPAELIAAHRRPRPPYDAGPQAAVLGATSMIDISDGLVQDLGHVAAASEVRADIDTSRLALDPLLPQAAAALGEADWLGWVLTGGEDHVLAATFPAGTRLPERWSVIGTIGAGRGVRVDGGSSRALSGWDHFR
jgi:thiamine-monophosphate kinase